MKKNLITGLIAMVILCALVMGMVPVSAVPTASHLTGDVDKDGKVSSSDYLIVKRIFQGKSVSVVSRQYADVNLDRKITTADFLIIKKIFNGTKIEFSNETIPLPVQPEIKDPGTRITYTVSGVFSSNMVLQRDKIIQVWGWSNNVGGYIYGELLGETRYAQIDKNGEWMLQFSPKDYTTEGTTLTIYPKNGKKTVFENILIGDVWMVSGQSNAEYYFRDMARYFTECYDYIDENNNIRLLRIDKDDAYDSNWHLIASGIQDDILNRNNHWTKTTTSTVETFSAVGYMFVKEISNHTEVPQGIVMAAAGGCILQEFMDPLTGSKYSNEGSIWRAEPNSIYKYMLAPFRHMTMRGILFYQGESNQSTADQYASMLTKCVAGWRKQFDSTFDFYNIQCTSHSALAATWPDIPAVRAAQLDAYYTIPGSYIIPTIDVGYRLRGEDEPEEDYAHPFDKKTIGERAAHIALAQLYGVDGFDYNYDSCPIPSNVTWSSDSVTIDFENVGDGLKAYSGSLIGFHVMQPNGKLTKANAVVIDKDTVKITLPNVRNIVSVCYAYEHSALIEEANLVNSNNIPCPTFKFDK